MRDFADVLEEDDRGPVVVRKQPDRSRLPIGGCVTPDDGKTAWEILRCRDAGTDVRCIYGPNVGKVETWSYAPIVGLLTPSQVDALRARKDAARVDKIVDRDEHRCPNCWPGEPAAIDGVDRGRDPRCADHLVSDEAVTAARRPPFPIRKRKERSPEDVAKVLELRAAGRSYRQIDEEMGWDRGSFEVVKAAGLTDAQKRRER